MIASSDDKQSNYRVAAKEVEEKFAEKMSQINLREKERLVQENAMSAGLNYINLVGFPIGPETLTLLSKEEALKYQAICFLKSGQEIRLGTINAENPQIAELVEKVAEKNQAHVAVYLISQHSYAEALKLYEHLPVFKKEVKGMEITQSAIDRYKNEMGGFKDLAEKVHQVPLTETLNLIIAGAIQAKASDLHIEAEENDIKVRYRLDGVLRDVATLPKDMWKRIISRIKLLAGLKINVDKTPQDGRLNLLLKEGKIDVRISTIPSAFGESVVMRLLMAYAEKISFEDLGVIGEARKRLNREIERPNGMIITSGPTGSGKTTALYSILNKLNSPETKIITLEDPIEYQLAGIIQTQIDSSGESDEAAARIMTREGKTIARTGPKRYTYANGLKSILRQDPDVIMVGEVRDLETAEIAIQAALTGHLVLSTIHANDAAGVIPRFLAMGTKPFLLAPALNAVMAQRLVRRICAKCKTEDHLDKETSDKIKETLAKLPATAERKVDLSKPLKFYRGAGCPACNYSTFAGRIGIFEVLIMNAEIEKIILSGQVSEYDMRDIAVKNGMVTMVQDGLIKALDGITSVSEVFRVAE
ncbi:MAG: GspE/PulE family protein [Patescibacteria group bacterium]